MSGARMVYNMMHRVLSRRALTFAQPAVRTSIRTLATSIPRLQFGNAGGDRTDSHTTVHTQTTARDKYPASLNVFHAGSFLTAYIGMVKLAGIYAFVFGIMDQGTPLGLESGSNFWWTSLAISLWSMPMIISHAITSPFVNSVNVLIPPAARKSISALKAFSSNPPGNTLLELTTLRFVPLPKRKTVRLEDLRILPPKRFRTANLEYLPPKLREASGGNPGWFKALIGGRRRFLTRPGERYTKTTRGPGVWEDLLDAIRKQGDKDSQPAFNVRRALPRQPPPRPQTRRQTAREKR